jgi:hypothetical protein
MFAIPQEFTLRYDRFEHTLSLDHPLLRHLQIKPLTIRVTELFGLPLNIADHVTTALCEQLALPTSTAATPEPEQQPAYAVFAQLPGGTAMQMLTSWRSGEEYANLFFDNVCRDSYISDILDAATRANPRLEDMIIRDTTVMIRRTAGRTYIDHNGVSISPDLLPITASQSTPRDTRTQTLSEYIESPDAMTGFDRALRELYNTNTHSL